MLRNFFSIFRYIWHRSSCRIISLLKPINVSKSTGSHQLLGPGACRGPKWSDGDWPIHVGDKSIDDCSQLCQKNKGCTSFSLSKGKGPLKPCLLYHHTDIQPAASLGGECFKITGIIIIFIDKLCN